MISQQKSQISNHERSDQRSFALQFSSRRLRAGALCVLAVAALSSCVVPMDTGANAAAMALDRMDALAYSMRNETVQLQIQIDSLGAALRKTDSLVRWVANLTGNPIINAPNWAIPFNAPPDTGILPVTAKVPPPIPPDGGTKPPPP